MLGSTPAPHAFNVAWLVGRRASGIGAADRYEYRPVPGVGDRLAGKADAGQDPPAGRALRPAPPAWRACRADMPRNVFLCLVSGWAGAALVLLATVLLIRFAG
jgi:hypothetical protein